VEPFPLVFTLAALGVETVGAADPLPLLGAALVALCECVTCLCAWVRWCLCERAGGVRAALFDAWPALWTNLYAYGPASAPILFSSALAAISLLTIGAAYPLLARE